MAFPERVVARMYTLVAFPEWMIAGVWMQAAFPERIAACRNDHVAFYERANPIVSQWLVFPKWSSACMSYKMASMQDGRGACSQLRSFSQEMLPFTQPVQRVLIVHPPCAACSYQLVAREHPSHSFRIATESCLDLRGVSRLRGS